MEIKSRNNKKNFVTNFFQLLDSNFFSFFLIFLSAHWLCCAWLINILSRNGNDKRAENFNNIFFFYFSFSLARLSTNMCGNFLITLTLYEVAGKKVFFRFKMITIDVN